MKAFESLKGMLCDPEGKVCIQGTDADRAEIQRHLNDAGKMIDMNNSLIGDNNHLRTELNAARVAATEIESLTAKVKELEAENARLKTVPMKYRRMAFNAELQDQLKAEQSKVKVLTDVLEPFSRLLQEHHDRLPDSQPVYGIGDALITIGDLRKALATVKAQ